ncbi:hypothetical protein EJ110_NYTH15396 [Nymphaea thermarum]|nr:hypothetical protein EJ110_NYTH15396 [Nymphaea thermarum]
MTLESPFQLLSLLGFLSSVFPLPVTCLPSTTTTRRETKSRRYTHHHRISSSPAIARSPTSVKHEQQQKKGVFPFLLLEQIATQHQKEREYAGITLEQSQLKGEDQAGRGYGLQGKELITSVQEFTSASQGSLSLDIVARLGVFKDDIRLRDANDSLVWSDDGKDNFRVADIMSKCRTQSVKEWWRKKIWYSSAPAKSCWHTYIASEGRLPTLDRLQKAGIHLANRCSLCLCAEENNGHILIKCKMAKEVWRYVAAKFGRVKFPQGEIVAEFKRWLQVRILGKWRRQCWRMTFLIVCWSLWCLRNTCFHDSIQPQISRFKKEVWRNCMDSFFAVKWSPETDLKLRIWLQTGLYSVDANAPDRSAILINIARAHTKLGPKIAGLSYADNGLMGCVVIIKDKGMIHEGELEVLERILRFHKDYGGDYFIVSPIKDWVRKTRQTLEGRRTNVTWSGFLGGFQQRIILKQGEATVDLGRGPNPQASFSLQACRLTKSLEFGLCIIELPESSLSLTLYNQVELELVLGSSQLEFELELAQAQARLG